MTSAAVLEASASSPSRPPTRSADRRLFAFAGGVWLASIAGLSLSPPRAWTGALVLATVVVAVLAWVPALLAIIHRRDDYRPRHLRRGAAWGVVALLLGAVCGLTATAARTAARDAAPLAALTDAQATVQADLVVTGDPEEVRSSAPGPATVLVPARLTSVVQAASGPLLLVDARVLVFGTGGAWRVLLPSQHIVATGRLGPSRGGDLTAAVLTASGPPELVGAPHWTQLAAGSLRAGLQAASAGLPTEPGGLLPGLVLGDTSHLDPALEADFRATGLTHLVAVSGANVAIVLGLVLFAARWLRVGPWPAAAVAGVALVGLVILVRPSPSVVRAAAMGAIGLLALATGRGRAAAAALAAAVVVGLLIDPSLAVSAGFALSVLATAALVLVAPRWRDGLRNAGVPVGLAEALAVPAAAFVACAPVIAGLSGQVSLIAIPANLLAAPAVGPATVLGVGSAVLSPVWPDGAFGLAWLASWPVRWLVLVAHTGASIPVGSIPWAAGWSGAVLMTALTSALLLAARRPVLRRLLLVVAVAAALGAVPIRWAASGWPPDGVVVVACDVGQGDAVVIPEGDGAAVVVDTGPDPVPVDACLRRLGVTEVSLLILTHFHVDHIGGVAGVFRGRRVDSVVLPTFDEPAAGETAVRSASMAAGTAVAEAGVGWGYRHGAIDLRVIGPSHPLFGTRSDPNNNSLIVMARIRGVFVLLAGDAEVEEQHSLLMGLGADALRADILKVAHHGSSFQDPELLDVVHPRVALVSVGADNPYGHPSLPVLRRLETNGARVLRTDLSGDIAVVSNPDGLAVVVAETRPRDHS